MLFGIVAYTVVAGLPRQVPPKAHSNAVLLGFAHSYVDQSRIHKRVQNLCIEQEYEVYPGDSANELDFVLVQIISLCEKYMHAAMLLEVSACDYLVTTEKIKSASEVLTDFLTAQAENKELDESTVLAIRDLRSEGKLTKTNLLQRLENARKGTLKKGEEEVGDPQDD